MLGLFFRTEERYGYFHIWADAVVVDDDGELRQVPDSIWDNPLLGMRDFRVSCQNEPHHAAEGGTSYGFSAEYNQPFSVDLPTAKAMVKWLTKLERGLEKIRQDYGPANDYSDYVLRVAKSLGIKRYFISSDGSFQNARESSASDVAYWVRSREREYINKCRGEAA